jgi:hypothetical protein
MDGGLVARILEAEERLRIAMLRSDVRALDELLAPELIFTNHLGQLLGKKDDIEAHESGLLQVSELIPSERHVQLHGTVAVVSVRMRVSGTYGGRPTDGDFRFTRVWKNASGSNSWHVVAAQASLVV